MTDSKSSDDDPLRAAQRTLAPPPAPGYLPAASAAVVPLHPRVALPPGHRDLPRFFQELKRRRVFQVAVAYLAVGWVAIDVSDTLLPAIGLPEWSITLVVAFVGLGFPVALILGWIYDLTPRGIERTESLEDDDADRQGGRRGRAGPRESIVVLPLRDRAPGAEHQFLGDGITEELIHGLARVEGLRVVSRTSAFALGQVGDVRDLGPRLGVGSVVEGSLLVREDRLRLNVQLVSAEDGLALWSETFDRRLDDVFEIQEDVARAVVGVVGRELGTTPGAPGGAETRLLTTSTRNVDAYQLYLKGRHHWNQRTGPAFRRAIDYFERATALDPGFAQAWAGLAECWALLMEYGLAPRSEGLEPAREAARRALDTGDGLAESHAAAALVRQLEWEWDRAAAESEAALALNPGYAPARHRWSLILAWLGRFDESRREIDAARALDPLAPAIAATGAWVAYYERRYADAVRIGTEVLEDHPTFATARIPLGLALVQIGRAEQAVAELRRAREDTGASPSSTALLAYALGRAGRVEEARALATELDAAAMASYVPHYYRALPPLGLGELDEVLEILARAVAERGPQLVYLGVEPAFDPLRGRAEFAEILEAVGLARAE